MKYAYCALLALLLSACASSAMRCDGHMRRINAPQGLAAAAQPPALGSRR